MSPRLPIITPSNLIRALQRGGFVITSQTGSHVFMHHPQALAKKVPIPYHVKDLKRGTLNRILKLAGLSIEELLELL